MIKIGIQLEYSGVLVGESLPPTIEIGGGYLVVTATLKYEKRPRDVGRLSGRIVRSQVQPVLFEWLEGEYELEGKRMDPITSDQLLAVHLSDSPIVGLATAMELKRLSCQSRLTQDRNEFISALKDQRLDLVVICRAMNQRYGTRTAGGS